MIAVVWWLVGLPIIFGLMMAPAALLAGIITPALYFMGADWRFWYAMTTLLGAFALAVWIVFGITTYKETEDGRTY